MADVVGMSGNAAADRPTELAHCIDGSTEDRSLDFGDECYAILYLRWLLDK